MMRISGRTYGWIFWTLGLIVFFAIMAPAGIAWWETMLAVAALNSIFIGADLLNLYPNKDVKTRDSKRRFSWYNRRGDGNQSRGDTK